MSTRAARASAEKRPMAPKEYRVQGTTSDQKAWCTSERNLWGHSRSRRSRSEAFVIYGASESL